MRNVGAANLVTAQDLGTMGKNTAGKGMDVDSMLTFGKDRYMNEMS